MPTVKVNTGLLLALLGSLFVGLKLSGYITWSWWWVTAPFWAPAAVILTLISIGIFGLSVAALWAIWTDQKDAEARAAKYRL